MGQDVRVSRRFKFIGDANGAENVEGNFNSKRMAFVADFLKKDLDTTNMWTEYLDTTSTVTPVVSTYITAAARLTTAATINKTCSLASPLLLYAQNDPIVEWKFYIDDITSVAINVGFNDATSEASNTLPFTISGTTITDNCLNGVMFVFDTAQNTDRWYVVNTNAGTEAGTLLPSGYAPVNNTVVTLRVRLDSSGNAWYYYNGELVSYKALAVATSTALCAYIGIKNIAAAAHNLYAGRLKIWGE